MEGNLTVLHHLVPVSPLASLWIGNILEVSIGKVAHAD
jgi:hypothetical protein